MDISLTVCVHRQLIGSSQVELLVDFMLLFTGIYYTYETCGNYVNEDSTLPLTAHDSPMSGCLPSALSNSVS